MSRSQNSDLKFASLQGLTAQKTLPQEDLKVDPDTVIYYRDGIIFKKSEAVFRVIIDLGGPWKLLQILFLLPRPFRDFFYERVARNRFRFFPKRETCRIPTPEEKARLLD